MTVHQLRSLSKKKPWLCRILRCWWDHWFFNILTLLPLKDVDVILQVYFSNAFYEFMFFAFHVKSISGECNKSVLVISQHLFRKWLGAPRQQVISWTNVDPVLCRHLASLGHNELKSNTNTSRRRTAPIFKNNWKTDRNLWAKRFLQGFSLRPIWAAIICVIVFLCFVVAVVVVVFKQSSMSHVW